MPALVIQGQPMYKPSLWPVSVKGVALDSKERVLLLHNERDEWELPGGRLEIGPEGQGSAPADHSPGEALERELAEESGWTVEAGPLLDAGTWIYEPVPGRRVLIVTYGCTVLTPDREPVLSHEHKRIGLFHRDEVGHLTMPEGYKQSITAWYDHPAR
ncbi:NUDIX domain-containing protein [Streptomyces sp. NPDC059247]|uniref:NUDIX domain-containing protein n=1 Tax=Streptomyces sp. NPDC059247 TaxID=3346790 RepID=UPI0036995EF1